MVAVKLVDGVLEPRIAPGQAIALDISGPFGLLHLGVDAAGLVARVDRIPGVNDANRLGEDTAPNRLRKLGPRQRVEQFNDAIVDGERLRVDAFDVGFIRIKMGVADLPEANVSFGWGGVGKGVANEKCGCSASGGRGEKSTPGDGGVFLHYLVNHG